MTPMDAMRAPRVLTLPGWQGSGPGHWQTHWESLHGDRRVEQHDWDTPRRGDWLARLDEVVVDSGAGPLVLVAHSLGCVLVAAWARFSRHTGRIRGALLVAPPDLERDDMPALLPGWGPVVRERLPFDSVVVASRDDPYGSFAYCQGLAQDWGARLVDVGARGHVNADSGLGDWAQGRTLLHPWLQTGGAH